MAAHRLIGARIKRQEDPRLITGRATYVDDIHLVNTLHMEVLRSPHAHARIKRIDVRKALALPGVVAVFTGQDARRLTPPLPAPSGIPDLKIPEAYALAVDKVGFAGEGVAAVIATSRHVARDALDLIEVDYEPLPAVVDPEKALEPEAPVLHEQFGSNVAYRLAFGDVKDALAEADLIVRQRLENQRLIPNAMETRGVLAHYQPGEDSLTLWVSTQAPHLVRTQLAEMLGMPENKMRVVAPEVGGAFGSKLNIYPEELLAAVLAKHLGRPIKWTETRQENMVATSHGRGQVGYLEAAVRRDGVIAALGLRIVADLGAHYHLFTPVAPLQTAIMMTGCYRIPNAAVEIIGVFTNKTPVDPYRGFYRAEATYYIERLMDLVARELIMDPVEVRRRNIIPPEQFPYTTPLGHVYDTGDYNLPLNRALEILGYDKFRREQERLRGEGRCVGVGFSTYVWRANYPSVVLQGRQFIVGGWETAAVRVEPSGAVTVLTGASPHGQGTETTFAQIVADQLGVPMDDVRVLHGDTQTIPYGMGSMGSRALVAGGNAVLLAAEKIKEKAVRLAAHLMEARPEDMIYEDGRIYVKGFPERAMSLREVAEMAYRSVNRPPGMEPGLEALARFDPPNFTSPFGTHICVVEVDPETGEVKLLRYIAVDDCGLVVNPTIVEGQILGGIAQGVGQALLEGAMYSEQGQLLTGSFLDYPMPTSTELPMVEIDRTETSTPVNPLGAKGAGEGGIIGAPPAVVNAVVDALSPLGIKHIDMPLWPEKVWRAIQQAKGIQ